MHHEARPLLQEMAIRARHAMESVEALIQVDDNPSPEAIAYVRGLQDANAAIFDFITNILAEDVRCNA